MTLRRLIALACLVAAFVGAPVLSATVDLVAGAIALIAFLGLAFLVALWPRSIAERFAAEEAAALRAMAGNITAGDPH